MRVYGVLLLLFLPVDGEGDDLCALRASRRERFREIREPGDISEHDDGGELLLLRVLGRLVVLALLDQVVNDHRRHEPEKTRGLLIGHFLPYRSCRSLSLALNR